MRRGKEPVDDCEVIDRCNICGFPSRCQRCNQMRRLTLEGYSRHQEPCEDCGRCDVFSSSDFCKACQPELCWLEQATVALYKGKEANSSLKGMLIVGAGWMIVFALVQFLCTPITDFSLKVAFWTTLLGHLGALVAYICYSELRDQSCMSYDQWSSRPAFADELYEVKSVILREKQSLR